MFWGELLRIAKGRREVQFAGRRWCQFTSAYSITFTTTAKMLRFFAADMHGKHGNFVNHPDNSIVINMLRNVINLTGRPHHQSVNESGSRGVQKAYLAANERIRERSALVEGIQAARGEYETKSQFEETAMLTLSANPTNAGRSHWSCMFRKFAFCISARKGFDWRSAR